MPSSHLAAMLLHLLLTGVSVFIVAKVLPGIEARSFRSALWFAFLVAVLNAVMTAVFWPLTIPFKVLTLGLGGFLLNGLVFLAAGRISGGVRVSGCLTGVLASIAVTFLTGVLRHLLFGA